MKKRPGPGQLAVLLRQGQAFIRFVLDHYDEDGVDELSLGKLYHLL